MDVLHGEPDDLPRRLSLPLVVEEAVRANLDLQAVDRLIAAGREDVREARAALLPQLTARVQGRIIDDDRATVGLPERTGSAALELAQRIYDEPTWANLRIQQSLQLSRESEKTITLLDVVLEATTGYLNVLSAKTVERIQRDNLNLTRTNLELARVRRSVGVARPNEVLRWESQVANDRRQVINAFAQREQTEIALNRVLHRPLEERFATVEPDLDDPRLITSFARILPYVDNPRYFEILREFMVQQGLEAAPELSQFEAQIAAQERTLQSAERSFYTPDVRLSGSLTGVETGGVGGSGAPGNDVNWKLAHRHRCRCIRGGANGPAAAGARGIGTAATAARGGGGADCGQYSHRHVRRRLGVCQYRTGPGSGGGGEKFRFGHRCLWSRCRIHSRFARCPARGLERQSGCGQYGLRLSD